MLSKLKGYKTIVFNAIMTVVMVLRLFAPDAELPDEVAVTGAVDALDAALTTMWGVGNLILRAVTDSPVFKPPPSVNSPVIVGILAAFIAAIALSGCAGTRQAYKAAEGVEQTAQVVAEHYYALVHQANELKQSGKLAGEDLVVAQSIVSKTSSVVIKMSHAAKAYEAVRSADNEAALEQAIADAAVAISALIDAIKGGGVTDAGFDDRPSLLDTPSLLAAT